MIRSHRTLLAAWLAVATAACGPLQFQRNTELKILSPAENGVVRLPLQLTWTGARGSRVAVFFDRSPVKAKASLGALVQGAVCDTPDCSSPPGVAPPQVYVTEQPQLQIDRLPDLRKNHHSKDFHEVTIVVLDSAGRRLNEAAFIRDFEVVR